MWCPSRSQNASLSSPSGCLVKSCSVNSISGIAVEWDALRQERHEIFYNVSSAPPHEDTIRHLIKVAQQMIDDVFLLLR